MRTGAWTYALVNLTHVLGIALLFGAVAVLDLRLLGLWRAAPAAALARATTQVAAVGVLLALPSGVALLSAQATEYVDNPFFWSKLALVLLGLVNIGLLRRAASWRTLDQGISARVRVGAAASLLLWLGAVSAGRLIAYW
jgi:hypothetical protein